MVISSLVFYRAFTFGLRMGKHAQAFFAVLPHYVFLSIGILFYINYSVLSVIGVAETGHAAEQPHSMVDSI